VSGNPGFFLFGAEPDSTIPTRAVAFMLAGFHVGSLGCLKFRLIEH